LACSSGMSCAPRSSENERERARSIRGTKRRDSRAPSRGHEGPSRELVGDLAARSRELVGDLTWAASSSIIVAHVDEAPYHCLGAP
jgi:hypothetical protein